MVKVIDGYQQEVEAEANYRRVYESAERLFPRRIRKNSLDKKMREIVIETDKREVSVEIYPNSDFMYVKQKSDFERAFELAEQGEKITGREFILKTTYPILVEQPKLKEK